MLRRRTSTELALTAQQEQRHDEIVSRAEHVGELAALPPRELRKLHRDMSRDRVRFLRDEHRLFLATCQKENLLRAEGYLDSVEEELEDRRYAANMHRLQVTGFKAEEVLAATSGLSETVREVIQTAAMFEMANHTKHVTHKRWAG